MNKILLRSSWQVVNIGDVAHTPSMLALLEKYLPQVEVVLWGSGDLSEEVISMEKKRFPKLTVVKGVIDEDGNASNTELEKAIQECDFLLHGSGPLLVGYEDIKMFVKKTGKPFGVFGITYGGYNGDDSHINLLNQAKFVYFRDSVSLEKAKEDGLMCPIMMFGPDSAFATDVRDDEAALAYLKQNNLTVGEYLCCIPRYRYTPYWQLNYSPIDQERLQYNNLMKEQDNSPLRQAIISVTRETNKKVLICPEDQTQIMLGKEILYDKLPEDVRKNVVWRDKFWLTDEALSIYVHSAGLFGNEMHSPIMCIGNGIPAIVCRWKEQTSKGFMWKDIGLEDWLFNMDIASEREQVAPAVLNMVRNTEDSHEKVRKAREKVQLLHKSMIMTLMQFLPNS